MVPKIFEWWRTNEQWTWAISLHYLIVALGMDDVHGPPDVINGIPLNVATPLSSVKRCCMGKDHDLVNIITFISSTKINPMLCWDWEEILRFKFKKKFKNLFLEINFSLHFSFAFSTTKQKRVFSFLYFLTFHFHPLSNRNSVRLEIHRAKSAMKLPVLSSPAVSFLGLAHPQAFHQS